MSVTTVYATRRPPALVRVNPHLWRVTSPTGAVVGHIERLDDPRGERFRARGLRGGLPSGAPLGEFWSVDDAVECFRAA